MGLRKFIDALRFPINRSTGWDIIYFSGQHTFRSHLVRIIDAYHIDTILDVGANEGQFGLHVRSLGFRGRILSFEPVDAAYEKLLKASASDRDWIAFDFALGATPDAAVINVSSSSDFSSILEVNEYARERWRSSEITHQQKIEIRTLDELVSEGVIEGNSRLLLKMDTQGYDLEVFRGAKSLLPHVSCMVSELSLIPIYQGMPSYLESLSAFESNGFHVSGMYPVTRNEDLTLNEVDCVLVNPSRHQSNC